MSYAEATAQLAQTVDPNKREPCVLVIDDDDAAGGAIAGRLARGPSGRRPKRPRPRAVENLGGVLEEQGFGRDRVHQIDIPGMRGEQFRPSAFWPSHRSSHARLMWTSARTGGTGADPGSFETG